MPRFLNRFDDLVCTGLILAVVLLSSAPPTSAQECSAPSVVLTSDEEVLLFANNNSGCRVVNGDIKIGSCNPHDPLLSCSVTSLSDFGSIAEIRGSLAIRCCAGLTELPDFQNLRMVNGYISIFYNQNLATISGFTSLQNVTSLQISQNPRLLTVTGFSDLSLIAGYLEIDRNPILVEINGFRSLQTIQGAEVILGHALTLTYNTNLTSLSGFVGLSEILYGTVHIEGNVQLCYAGYPQWTVGSYPMRPEVVGGVDVGIDWRTKLSGSVPSWQYTWSVPGGGFPTLLIQNNSPLSGCGDSSCDITCAPGAGCLGPNSPSLCGTCRRLDNTTNTCNAVPTPPTGGTNSTAIALGIVIPILMIIFGVLIGLGIWGGIVLSKRWRTNRQGSFDIAYTSGAVSVEGGVKFVTQQNKASEQIAEPTPLGSSVTRSGLRRQPIDKVVMSSYQQKTSSLTRPQSRTTPTRSAPSPSSRNVVKRSPPSSSHSPPPPPPSSSRSEHPMTAKRAQGSYSPSEPRRPSPVTVAARGAAARTSRETTQTSTNDTLESMNREPVDVPMNFPREQIKLGKEFGEGDFGKVFQADAKKLLPGQKKTTVVVKQLKEGATKEERDVFLRPVEAMKILQHSNVLSLLGVSIQGPSILVLLEYCAQGNFKTFLVRKRREAAAMKQSKQLVKMACDMASGLNYLHSKSIAHNDFATRSCLVTEEGIVKLGDYGITRETFKEDYYSRGKNQKAWPIRWMAPEQIVVQGRNILDSLPVSLQANIWSFGVALWEVCSFAQWPYEEMGNEEVIQTVTSTRKCLLENPLQPNDAIAPLFDVCLLCWQPFELRPSMSELLHTLKDILAGGKVNWPARHASGGVAQQGESPGNQRPHTPSSGYRPKRPAPTRPPGRKSGARSQKEKDEGLVISNPAAAGYSQDEAKEEEGSTKRNTPPSPSSQDTGLSALAESDHKSRASKSHKPLLKQNLSSSKELLLEDSSGSQSVEEGGKTDVSPIQTVPAPPPSVVDDIIPPPLPVEGVDEASVTAEHKKRRHRKSSEVKSEDEGKLRSKSKSKKKTEHDKSAKRTSRSGHREAEPPSRTPFKMSEPMMEEGELPLPQEIAEAAADEAIMIGAGGGDEEDFILQPPPKFSQTSVDYLDDFGDIEESGPLSFDFAPPTAPSEDEMEDEPHPPIGHTRPHPPISYDRPIQKHKASQLKSEKTSESNSEANKKKNGGKKPREKLATAANNESKGVVEFPTMEDEWEGLDYPIRRSPWSGGSQETDEHLKTTFPRDQDGEFVRDALEEEEDGVVLDEDVAALLW